MELSSIKFYQKRYTESLDVLNDAQNLADDLYTKSIRQLILSSVLGDDYKDFYGKIFERSALFHLQILNLYSLYSGEEYLISNKVENKEVTEKKVIPIIERESFLMQARSVALAWDSFYSTLQKDSASSYFSKDYYQQIFNAHIHEEVGSRQDLNIAMILYENTLKEFERLISLYPSFNLNSELSIQSYLKDEGPKNVQLSAQGQKLKEFVKLKFLTLVKKIDPKKLKSKIKMYSPNDKTLAQLNSEKEFVSVFIINKFVRPIQEKVISYNLNRVLNKIEDPNVRNLVEVIGISTLTYFTLGTLGLPVYAYSSDGQSRSYVYTNLSAGNELIKNIGIDIKVPFRDSDYKYAKFELFDNNISVDTFGLLNSYSERASIATQEFANRYYSALGPKIAIKYLLAIVGAYTTYNTLKKAENPFSSILALTQYYASTKVIANTHTVDTRSWVGIPSSTQFLTVDKKSLRDNNNLTLKVDDGTQVRLPTSNNRSLFFLKR